MSAWIYLALAILLEVGGTFFLKLSNGFEKWSWGMVSIACYCACFMALAPAIKVLPVGVVYAIWAGVGIIAATLLGAMAFGERLGMVQLLCITLVIIGVVGLKFSTQ